MSKPLFQMLAASLAFVTALVGAHAGAAPRSDTGIRAFNEAFRLATQTMQVEGLIALWEDDGVTLLPDTPPIVGKAAIARYLTEVTKQLGVVRVRQFDLTCLNLLVSGDWASEWCQEHQIVDLGKEKPPFEGRGNLLLVLHRRADGQWRLIREMWNQAARE